jgi:hypothetical protein
MPCWDLSKLWCVYVCVFACVCKYTISVHHTPTLYINIGR